MDNALKCIYCHHIIIIIIKEQLVSHNYNISHMQTVSDTVNIVDTVEDWPADVVEEESNE